MSSLWTDLLFMHGHITNLDLVRRLAEAPKPTSTPAGKRKLLPELDGRSANKARPALADGDCPST